MIGRQITVAAALALLSLLPASAKNYHAERYLLHLQLDPQGSLHVTETAVFRFADGPFTYVYRDLSTSETDGIADIAAAMDDQPCPPGTAPGEAEINGTLVRWHFAPTSDRTRTFSLHYTVRGVIRKAPGADTLIWRALPKDRSYQTDGVGITLDYPAGAANVKLSVRPETPVAQAGAHAVLQISQVKAGQDVVLTARFAPGTFGTVDPDWLLARASRRGNFGKGLALGGVAGVLLVTGVCGWLFKRRSRWARPAPLHSEPEYSPPTSLSPALAGRLAGRPPSSQAVLLHLAHRGAIEVEPKPGRFQRDFTLTRHDAAFALAPHETVLVHAAFGDKPSTTLSRYQQRAAAVAQRFGRTLTEYLVGAGLFDAERLAVRTRVRGLGTLLLAAGFGSGVMSLLLLAKAATRLIPGMLVPVGIALALSGLAVLVFSTQVSVLSDPGAIEARRWKRFAVYLQDIASERAPLPSIAEWDKWLPYAAALGVATPLLQRARREGSLRIPVWFVETPDGGDSFAAFMTTSSASTSYGGGDGGAGASGGGSSGAG